MQQLDVYYQYFLNMFRASLCPSSGEQDVCYCRWCAALVLAQHTTCSNTSFVLLKMGIMMPETCWESIAIKHLTVASCWFSLSLHNLLTMHGHRNLKLVICDFYKIKKRTKVMPNISFKYESVLNPLNAELNPICHLLALLQAHHILHVSRIRVNSGRSVV